MAKSETQLSPTHEFVKKANVNGMSLVYLAPNATKLVDPKENRQPAAQKTNVFDIQHAAQAL